MADQTAQPDSAGSPDEPAPPSPGEKTHTGEKVETLDPQRLLRIAGVTREVLDEARRIRPEAGAVEHLKQVHARITEELHESLPPELWEELDELTPDIRDGSLEELALAHSEILGWLEGLFQGTQLAIQLQAARMVGDQQERRLRRPDSEADPDGRYL